MSEYDKVVGGSLHLKCDQGIKKKKKHKKPLRQDIESSDVETETQEVTEERPKTSEHTRLTKAQKELERRKVKRTLETVLSKPVKSHKQRIIEFNNHLETLTEHFDIQKVSWTK
ncbi:hypothetical protein P879_01666 [Paragonimus westermani]|uniref:Protein FAM32A n=1 Tax=Paragonimus westermani TaxID=34504 RepID=A0A8T0DSL5_9TREM|nr:hypothetical protein P879_01666 [Paragonimus westermani]